jgi:MtN3 and saliva related transmembrane protein
MRDLIGILAGTLTTISFFPQVIKTWRSQRADDLSFGMLFMFALGVGLWNVYGMLLRATPIIAANAVTLVLILAIVGMKMRYARSGAISTRSTEVRNLEDPDSMRDQVAHSNRLAQ